MLEKYMNYGMEKDLTVEELMILHDEYDYAVVLENGKIKDFIYEGTY